MDRGRLSVNELLTNGYFTTARGRSPASARPASSPTTPRVPSFLRADYHTSSYEGSRSRGPRSPPPPPPTVEDEEESLAKEQHAPLPTYDPPAKGVIEQNPIILEADISEAEAARLHENEQTKGDDRNAERRFVFVPRSDTSPSTSEDDIEKRKQRKRDSGKAFMQEIPVRGKVQTPPLRDRPGLERVTGRQDLPIRERKETSALEGKKIRQDLPSLQTKVPREIPPQFKRRVSSFASSPKAGTPSSGSRPNGEYFLSPETLRQSKDNFTPSQSAPRYGTNDFGGRAATQHEKRNSASYSSTRPTTPNSDKRQSGSHESSRPPSRRSSRERLEKLEKLTRPQQLAESGRRSDRPPLPQRNSTMQSSHSSRYYSSSDDDLSDSDSDRRRRRIHRNNQLHPADNGYLRSSSKSSTTHRPLQPTSRRTSPLPSPKVSPSQLPVDHEFGRSGTFPLMKKTHSRPSSPNEYRPDQKLNPFEVPPPAGSRPHSRQSSQSSFPIPMPMPIPMPSVSPNQSSGSLPVPIPSRVDVYSPGEIRRNPAISQNEEIPLTAKPQEKPLWQPPKFQPPSHLDKPVGSYRRYSEDVDRGVTPLATCPRKNFVRGRNDWLTLPQCPGFDICPSCYESTMAPTEFRNMFIPAPFRNPDTKVLCDFGSSPWYRIAWLLTLKDRRRDLALLYSLAKISNSIQPCLGSQETTRQWYSILDPKTGLPVRNFDVCYSCVKSTEVLLPAIRGIFIPTDAHLTSAARRVCDLRVDSKRFVQYFDAFETTADQANYNSAPPDTRSLTSLVRRFAATEECQRSVDLRDARWHLITQLPEFTVCPECFDEVVWPELSTHAIPKAIPLMFKESPQRLPRASCQLYSKRMRGVFKTAVEADDYKFLASKARERKGLEVRWKGEGGELKRLVAAGAGGRRLEGELERLVGEWEEVE